MLVYAENNFFWHSLIKTIMMVILRHRFRKLRVIAAEDKIEALKHNQDRGPQQRSDDTASESHLKACSDETP